MDRIRILRVIEYSGPRDYIEELITNSITGDKYIPHEDALIRVTTVGEFPTIVREDYPFEAVK